MGNLSSDFFNELSETKYNLVSSEAHSILDYQEQLYRVSEEIAWYLYQRNNENLQVPDSEIKRIIKELKRDEELRLDEDEWKIVTRCYALCGYWKASINRGCVEFYHNNIRDFFLCEKLMRELNTTYDENSNALTEQHGNITPFLRSLCRLFQHGKLEKRVLFFLHQRALYYKDKPDFCVDMEREGRYTARIFENMLLHGDFYSICEERWRKENPVRTIACILSNTMAVYCHLYNSFLKAKELIQWWSDINAVNDDGTFSQLSGQILEYAELSNLSHADLGRTDLSSADLNGADLSSAYLRGAYLRFADLNRVNLRRANLGGAYLYGANLSRADLGDANLCNADMQQTYLKDAYLRGANLNGANLQFADAQFADIRLTDLNSANLQNADLRNANLQGADLRNANLQNADLANANLYNANLNGTDLRGAKRYNLKGTRGIPITNCSARPPHIKPSQW